MDNRLKTALLMTLLTILIVLFGNAVGGTQGMVIALIFALVMNFGSYWFSDKIALSMMNAQPIERRDYPELFAIVEDLTYKADLPMPRLYLIPSQQPNAFATGRNPENAAVAVTQGLMNLLNRQEIEGVLAHELAHVKNRDILISTIVAVMAGVITTLADWAQWALLFGRNDDEDGSGLAALPMIILGPLAAVLIQMGVSRSREYLADSTGAKIVGSPDGLANALLKLESASRMVPMNVNPSTSHLFIVNPLNSQRLVNLFSTHPPIQERVKRLREMR